jgi:hypothetical protein
MEASTHPKPPSGKRPRPHGFTAYQDKHTSAEPVTAHSPTDGGDTNLPRRAGRGADGRAELVPVEAATLAGAHGAAVSPCRVRVAEPLTLSSALAEVPLPVRVGGHVARVDGDIPPDVRVSLAERRGEPIQACDGPSGPFIRGRLVRPVR